MSRNLSKTAYKILRAVRDQTVRVGQYRRVTEKALIERGLIVPAALGIYDITDEGKTVLSSGNIYHFKKLPKDMFSSDPEIKIEKNIPIPPTARPYNKTSPGTPDRKYPWEVMEIGDSFYIEAEEKTNERLSLTIRKLQSRLSSVSNNYGRRVGKSFTTRRLETGIRIWRIK